MGKSGGNFKLRSARVIRQPGDGNCLFHSMAYHLGGTNAGQPSLLSSNQCMQRGHGTMAPRRRQKKKRCLFRGILVLRSY